MAELKNFVENRTEHELTRAKRSLKLVSLAVLIINCVYLPAAFALQDAETLLSVSVAVINVVYFYMTSRRLGKVIFPSIIYILAASAFGFLLSTAVFSAFVTISVGGFLIITAEKRDIALLVCAPAVIYLISFSMTLDPITSVFSFLFVPALLALGISGRLRAGRTSSICSVIITVIATAALIAGIYAVIKHVSLSDVRAAVEDIRNNLVDEFIRALTEYEESIGEAGAVSSSLDRNALVSMLGQAINLLPAIAIVSVSVFSFLANSSCLDLLKNASFPEKLTPAMQTFEMSMASGIIFFVAFAFSLTTSDAGNPNLLSFIGLNVFIILMPGLIISGYASIMSLLAKRPGGAPGLTLLVFLFIVIFYYIAIFVLAFWGAAAVIIKNVAAWSEKRE